MSATLIVRHTVADYSSWRKIYDEVGPLRDSHGCTKQAVLQLPTDANDVLVIHEFPSVDQANAFAGDPNLRSAMDRAGVSAPPRIEIFKGA
jgi:hypothetical protein